MYFFRALFAMIAIMLSGCVPSSSQGLRENAGGKISFDLNDNYQVIYGEILAAARNCWQNGLDTVPMVVHGDLDTDTRQGNITAGVPGLVGLSTYFTVDVKALSDAKTKVVVYFVFQSMEPRARAVELWVKQNSTQCRAP